MLTQSCTLNSLHICNIMWHVDDTVMWSCDLGGGKGVAILGECDHLMRHLQQLCSKSQHEHVSDVTMSAHDTLSLVCRLSLLLMSACLTVQPRSNIVILNFLLSVVFTPHVGRRSVVQSSSDNCGFKSQGRRQESKQKTWMRINKLSELLLLSIRAEVAQWDCHSQ